MYTHINRDMRIALGALLYAGMSQRQAAKELGISHTSISREVRRNARSQGYHATHADVRARKRRRRSKEQYRMLENNHALADMVEALLDPLVSPEVIGHEVGIAHETIYAWIARSRPDLLNRLSQRGRKRRRYGTKRACKQGWTRFVRSIDERDDETGWEGDTIKGSTRARVLTHVDRMSLFTVADLMPDGTADSVHAVLKQHQKIGGTVTYDRGSEFALWQMIERDTDATVYFAHPHHPWERGKNENTNGRLRRPFPKRFDFRTISQRDLDGVTGLMNHTPRKSLFWQTSCRMYGKGCCASD
jgi:IS30 family transposase